MNDREKNNTNHEKDTHVKDNYLHNVSVDEKYHILSISSKQG